jgi:hypothetical protein
MDSVRGKFGRQALGLGLTFGRNMRFRGDIEE